MGDAVNEYLAARLKSDAARKELREQFAKWEEAERLYREASEKLMQEHQQLVNVGSLISELRKGLKGASENEARHEPARSLTRSDRAEAIACYVVITAASRCQNEMHFSVANNQAPVPFAVHWHFMDFCGVSFDHSQLAVAIDWVKEALLASYGVSWNATRSKGNFAHYMNYDLSLSAPNYLPGFLRRLRERKIDVENLPGYAVMRKIIDTGSEEAY